MIVIVEIFQSTRCHEKKYKEFQMILFNNVRMDEKELIQSSILRTQDAMSHPRSDVLLPSHGQ